MPLQVPSLKLLDGPGTGGPKLDLGCLWEGWLDFTALCTHHEQGWLRFKMECMAKSQWG